MNKIKKQKITPQDKAYLALAALAIILFLVVDMMWRV